MKKVALVSLGCAKNLVDSEVMLGHLAQKNYTLVADLYEADAIVVNTCGFIQPARQEALDALNDAIEAKRAAQDKKIVAAGCYVERNKHELASQFPEVDYWIGINDFDKIVSVLEEIPYQSSSQCFLYNHLSPRILSTPSPWAYIKISEGCSHRCSFCAIPLIKGPYRSRPIQSIIKESTQLSSRGVKEINLISQDSTYYGHDLGLKNGLTTLLEEMLKVKGVEWIRVLYGYPEEISDSLLEIMQEKKICSYLDIPFQHADSYLIKQMRRGLDAKRALRLIQKIRSKLPDVALRTSLIVGFPGEGNQEFGKLLDFVKAVRFDHLGVFTYSPEEGTDCFSLGDPIKESTKLRRKDKILQVQAELSYQNNERFLNQKVDVLIEGHLKDEPHLLMGRTQRQAPEVDGVVFIEEDQSQDIVIGSIQNVEITDRDIYDLYAKGIK
ncbi:30S ribosomal protein S12 methylthiotransferase RimO [Acidobacteriota bacterium]